jgi:hypothetical protein
MTARGYLTRLSKYINGLADVIFFYCITNSDDMQYRLGLLISEEEFPAFEKAFRKKENEALDKLNPRILIEHLKIDRFTQNKIPEEDFGFNFNDAAGRIGTLLEALKSAEIGDIKAFKRIIIKAGPKNLEYTETLHPIIEKFYSMAAVETKDQYVEVAEKMGKAMDQAKNKLSQRILDATPQSERVAA